MEKKGKVMTVFSRHPSHNILRGKLRFPFRACVRFGSINPGKFKYQVEINTVNAIETSSNKRLMKQAFDTAGIHTAKWYTDLNTLMQNRDQDLHFPIIAKNIFGSRGKGNHLFGSRPEIESWLNGRNVHNYIFEQYYSYNREYRLHVTANGCFYACRKLLKEDTPEKNRWYRNDSNSTWILESNEKFDRPVNWDIIVQDCVNALKSVGLDIGAFDVRVQSAKTEKDKIRKNPEFIVIESNSAPSFGEITAQKYAEILPQLILEKQKNSN